MHKRQHWEWSRLLSHEAVGRDETGKINLHPHHRFEAFGRRHQQGGRQSTEQPPRYRHEATTTSPIRRITLLLEPSQEIVIRQGVITANRDDLTRWSSG